MEKALKTFQMNVIFSLSAISFYNEDPTLPIYAKGRSQPCSTMNIAELLVNGVKPELICTNTPIYVKNNVEFIVDTNALNDWRDIRTDLNCGLQRSGTKSFHYEFSEGKAYNAEKINCTHVATRYLYVHKIHSDFHKVIVNVKHLESGKILPLFYIQYYFDDGEHQIDFEFQRAGRSSKKVIEQTKFSVRAEIKSLAREGLKGKAIFNRLCSSAGGFENARSSSDFPNSTTQIYNIVRKEVAVKKEDDVVELIDLCK